MNIYNNPIVLIVEDHEDTRMMLKILLGMSGCRVFEAADGERATCVAEEVHPDLILLDMQIPLLDGIAVTRLIRNHPTLKRVPIVAVTGNADPRFQAETLKTGCDYCLAKPIDFDRLDELIRILVRSTTAPTKVASHRSMAVGSRGA